MKVAKIFILTVLFAVIAVFVVAQKNKTLDRSELEKQRLNILSEIKQTQEQLGALQKDKNATVQQLQALQTKLNARHQLIDNINKDLGYLTNNIAETNNDVQNLNTNLGKLRKQYAELIRYSYKQRISQSLLMFFFSSKNFNDAIRRYQYIKQYKEYRRQQAQTITYTSNELKQKLNDLSEQKKQKDQILQVQQQQQQEISAETNQKNAVVLQLKGKESLLTKQLGDKQRIASNLNNAIATAIRREIELARKKAEMERKIRERQEAELARAKEKELAMARAKQQEEERRKLVEQNKKVTAVNKSGMKPISNNNNYSGPNPRYITSNNNAKPPSIKENNTSVKNNSSASNASNNNIVPKVTTGANPFSKPASSNYSNDISNNARMLSAQFEASRGSLQSPVSGGYICEHFGKVKHPIYNVYTENFGVDIRTSKGAPAYSIFAGQVSSVFNLAGTGTNILVNHGTYFTVYSKLEKVNVTVGQIINTHQQLGSVLTDAEGNTQVHLEIWKVGANGAPQKLNPEQWIIH